MHLREDYVGELDNSLQFHDSKLRNEFTNFCELRKSPLMILLAALFYSLVMLPVNIMSFFFTASFYDAVFTSTTIAVLAAIATMSWSVYYYQMDNMKLKGTSYQLKHKSIQSLLMILLSVSLCLMTYRSVLRDFSSYPVIVRQLLPGFHCMDTSKMSGELIAFFAILPIAFSVSLCESRLERIILWIAFTSGFLTTVSIKYESNYTVSIVLWTIGILILVTELHMQKLAWFSCHYKLQTIIGEAQHEHYKHDKEEGEGNNNNSNETLTEMKHIIGNLAHDLKTPLTSFTTGLDLMEELIEDEDQHIRNHIPFDAYNQSKSIASMRGCVKGLKNTNAFMLMTINRCIDYTKIQKGITLMPRFETIALLDCLKMPLECMKDIQDKIKIVLNPIPNDICSYIFTDKQWLQENLLCLLSNAVKYTLDGVVDITIYSIPTTKPTYDDKDGNKPLWFLRFDIQDMGIGSHLTEETMKTLFIPSKQAERLVGGAGLGLYSLAKRIEAIHGEYGVSKRDDHHSGLLFWFAIPYQPDWQMAEAMVMHKQEQQQHQQLEQQQERSSVPFSSFESYSSTACAWSCSGGGKESKSDKKLLAIEETTSTSSSFFLEHNQPFSSFSALSSSSSSSAAAASFTTSFGDYSTTIPATTTTTTTTTTVTAARPSQYKEKGDSKEEGKGDDGEVSWDILLVDDVPSIIKLTSMMLTRQGHKVTIAENGEIALQKLKLKWTNAEAAAAAEEEEAKGKAEVERKPPQKGYDFVLMDLQMPIMNGLEATKQWRLWEQQHHHSPPSHQWIIGMSANSDYDTMQDAIEAGIDNFMEKPFTMNVFNSIARTLLSSSSSSSS